jgi:hypothetical protein
LLSGLCALLVVLMRRLRLSSANTDCNGGLAVDTQANRANDSMQRAVGGDALVWPLPSALDGAAERALGTKSARSVPFAPGMLGGKSG